jgi:hypothetical protein
LPFFPYAGCGIDDQLCSGAGDILDQTRAPSPDKRQLRRQVQLQA